MTIPFQTAVIVLHSNKLALVEKDFPLTFPVRVSSTGQEFYDELLFQYPKLREGKGFELLRVPEGGGKDLEVIKEPDGGYNVEFLHAVVHSARIFIRPLQKSLDLRPQTSEVSQNITIKVELTECWRIW